MYTILLLTNILSKVEYKIPLSKYFAASLLRRKILYLPIEIKGEVGQIEYGSRL